MFVRTTRTLILFFILFFCVFFTANGNFYVSVLTLHTEKNYHLMIVDREVCQVTALECVEITRLSSEILMESFFLFNHFDSNTFASLFSFSQFH